MKRNDILIGGLLLALAVTACEVPKSPDFTTSQKIEAPILLNKTYRMIGNDNNAFIDTTKSDLDSLFTIGGDDFIIITNEEEFDFGDLDDAIPVVNVNPITFSAQVGNLEIGSFSTSSGNLGEASFAAVTGLGVSPNPGDPVPPQSISPEVTIDLNTDRFESADFSSGELEIRLTNNLGFDLDNISITLISSPNGGLGTDIASDATPFLADGEEGVVTLDLTGQTLSNPQVRVSINWTSPLSDPQTFQRTPQSIIVNEAQGIDLEATSITAALDSQDFTESGTAGFNNSEFSFTQPDHFIELNSGSLIIQNIQNQLGLDVDNLEISFPGILAPPFDASDSLVVSLNVPANSSSAGTTQNLSGYRIYAQGDQILYNISSATSGTDDNLVTISSNDQVSADIGVLDLDINFVTGVVSQQSVLLGDDDPSNGTDILDLFNDTESEVTLIDGLEDFSKELDGLEFTNPSISFSYTTNLGISTTVYGAIWGINANDESLFLTADTGSPFEVTAPVSGLNANGTPLNSSQLIKFDIASATDPAVPSTASVTFDRTNTNVDEFLNNLPDEIRFIGKAEVNENSEEGFIIAPVQIDQVISVEIPMAFSTPNGATFRDTTDESSSTFEDLPSSEKGDDYLIKSGRIILDYQNGLPLSLDIQLNLLDADRQLITSIPEGGLPIQFGAASVDANNFAANTFNDQVQIALSEGQLNELYKAAYVELSATFTTTNNSSVRIRTTDSVTISARAELVVENEVKGD